MITSPSYNTHSVNQIRVQKHWSSSQNLMYFKIVTCHIYRQRKCQPVRNVISILHNLHTCQNHEAWKIFPSSKWYPFKTLAVKPKPSLEGAHHGHILYNLNISYKYPASEYKRLFQIVTYFIAGSQMTNPYYQRSTLPSFSQPLHNITAL